jgi:pectate lyase
MPLSRLTGPLLALALAATTAAFAPAATGTPGDEPTARAATQRKAFPGAQGFGTATPGGRGGRVILVTTLADRGPGSLRAALSARGKRIVVFRVSGTITLRSGLELTSPYVTLAGQSAPGGGITLRVAPCSDDAALGIYTHDVVVRHLRVRRGANTCGGEGDSADGIVVYKENAHDVVVDHSSVSWAVDENLSTYDYAKNVTFSWNIVSEGLSRATHPEGEHSKGVHLSGDRSGRISFHHNLLAHNMDRNPQPTNPGIADIRNNIVYNYGDNAALTSNSHGEPHFNFVGNWYIPGPDTERSEWELDVYDGTKGAGWAFYVKGNLGPHRKSNDLPQRRTVSPEGRGSMVSAPFPAPATVTTSATTAYDQVLEGAGATRPVRDAVDQRIVREVRARGGRIIDDPSQVGGWPSLPATPPPPDSDRDGVPDTWESEHGTNPGLKDSNRDVDGDGWTNVEEWLDALAR